MPHLNAGSPKQSGRLRHTRRRFARRGLCLALSYFLKPVRYRIENEESRRVGFQIVSARRARRLLRYIAASYSRINGAMGSVVTKGSRRREIRNVACAIGANDGRRVGRRVNVGSPRIGKSRWGGSQSQLIVASRAPVSRR